MKFDPQTFLALKARAIKRAEEQAAEAFAAAVAVASVYASVQPGGGPNVLEGQLGSFESRRGSMEGCRGSMEGRSRLNSFAPSEASGGVRSRLGSFVEPVSSPTRRSGSLLAPSAQLPQLPNNDSSLLEYVKQFKFPLAVSIHLKFMIRI